MQFLPLTLGQIIAQCECVHAHYVQGILGRALRTRRQKLQIQIRHDNVSHSWVITCIQGFLVRSQTECIRISSHYLVLCLLCLSFPFLSKVEKEAIWKLHVFFLIHVLYLIGFIKRILKCSLAMTTHIYWNSIYGL